MKMLTVSLILFQGPWYALKFKKKVMCLDNVCPIEILSDGDVPEQ